MRTSPASPAPTTPGAATPSETRLRELDPDTDPYADVPGFCRSATIDEIREHGHVLTPGRYVGAAAADADEEPFEEKLARLTAELEKQFTEGREIEDRIRSAMSLLRT